jgi:hypothetical protein
MLDFMMEFSLFIFYEMKQACAKVREKPAKSINFLEIAHIELDDAIEYYNYELPCLGDTFLNEVLNALDRIGEFPEAWHPCSRRARRCQTRRFPYGIIYQINE